MIGIIDEDERCATCGHLGVIYGPLDGHCDPGLPCPDCARGVRELERQLEGARADVERLERVKAEREKAKRQLESPWVRGKRFNETTGALSWNYRPAYEHPDCCTCQGTDPIPHKHYNDEDDLASHACARCLECEAYAPRYPE
jgi:hypothetical protein